MRRIIHQAIGVTASAQNNRIWIAPRPCILVSAIVCANVVSTAAGQIGRGEIGLVPSDMTTQAGTGVLLAPGVPVWDEMHSVIGVQHVTDTGLSGLQRYLQNAIYGLNLQLNARDQIVLQGYSSAAGLTLSLDGWCVIEL